MPYHIPVLLQETLNFLNPRPGEIFIDATFGGGGHTFALLQKIKPNGRMLAIDADQQAIERFKIQIPKSKFQNLIPCQGNFRDLEVIAKSNGFDRVDGILFDLGFSSNELEDENRGFSFQKVGPLDMRFDTSRKRTAADILEHESEQELAAIFKDYGEERFAKRVARGIVAVRFSSPILTTIRLFDVIKRSLPAPLRHRASDSARRVFQALRIAVNDELESLKAALPQALALLTPGGRIAVISFHSLEDRIVKNFFKEKAHGCICPPEFPECICGRQPELRLLTKKPIVAGEREISENSRSKPAKLRAATKV